jgi:site-specific recombinase XerC
MASVPRMKHTIRRAEIYARSEVEAILSAPRQPRDRAFLMTVYACGLRLAEARHLKTSVQSVVVDDQLMNPKPRGGAKYLRQASLKWEERLASNECALMSSCRRSP